MVRVMETVIVIIQHQIAAQDILRVVVMAADQDADVLTVTESDMAIAVIIITYIMMDNVASPETEITRNHQPV